MLEPSTARTKGWIFVNALWMEPAKPLKLCADYSIMRLPFMGFEHSGTIAFETPNRLGRLFYHAVALWDTAA